MTEETKNPIETGTETVKPKTGLFKKVKRYFWLALILFVLIYGSYYAVTRFWPINEKQTAGVLQSYGQEGRIIVTYEGTLLTQELIQDPESGLSVRRMPFSLDKGQGEELRNFFTANVGKDIRVYYKKYQKSFFWRGGSVYVVYKAELLKK